MSCLPKYLINRRDNLLTKTVIQIVPALQMGLLLIIIAIQSAVFANATKT